MIAVFRCSARNWLLFVVQPLAAFAVSHCVCVCLCLCASASVCVIACIHVGSCVCACVCVCVCVWRGQDILCLLRCASAACDLQLGSFMSLFPHCLCAPCVPLDLGPPPPLSRQPPLSPSFFPSVSVTFILSSFVFIVSLGLGFRSIDVGYQDVKSALTCFSSFTDHKFVVCLTFFRHRFPFIKFHCSPQLWCLTLR